MKDNNQLLAEKIYEIENANFRQVKQWRQNGVESWELTDKIRMRKSDDNMCWYLWKLNEDEGEYGYFKVVPHMYYKKDTIKKVLEAQPWSWI